VTNFYLEANTLYRQQDGGFFTDESRERGVADSSLFLLGFGTQALDGELDGEPDLVITNGHIDDFTYSGTPFQMPPQYYRNVGAGYFQELPGADIGPYFQRKLLGRGLARLDWNGDGREDFAVSHLDAPVALLENRTTPCGHFLAVELRGTQSARDAIGARVLLQAGGRRWSKQLTAGDGYMASNQRLLTFGLGAVTQADRLEIVWPSGQHQQWEHLPVDCRMLFREGDASPYVRQPFQADQQRPRASTPAGP